MADPAVPAAPSAPATAWTWARRYVQSNFVVLLFCAFLFFFLLRKPLSSLAWWMAGVGDDDPSRDLVSLRGREVASAVLLGCWQVYFLMCFLTRRRLPWLWPAARTTAVVLFVGWQLFFLLVRNPLDFWDDSIADWLKDRVAWEGGAESYFDSVNKATRHYGAYNGIDQNWRMFTPQLSRSAQFLAARVEFTDGSDDVVLSEDEPDPHHFFRFGGWRQRKLEYALAWKKQAELGGDDDLPLLQAYARWSLRRWRAAHPDDPRTPARVVLLRRDIAFPEPDDDPSVFPPAEVSTVAAFLPDGSLAP